MSLRHGLWLAIAGARVGCTDRSASGTGVCADISDCQPGEVCVPSQCRRLCRAGEVSQFGGRAPRVSWSELASRRFGVDVERCERCGFSPLRVVAVVTPSASAWRCESSLEHRFRGAGELPVRRRQSQGRGSSSEAGFCLAYGPGARVVPSPSRSIVSPKIFAGAAPSGAGGEVVSS